MQLLQNQRGNLWPRLQNKRLFVHFIGWFPFKDYAYFAMEYCRYGDISVCYPNPLSEVESRGICAQLLEGLAVLHDLGITHRDIKPQVAQAHAHQLEKLTVANKTNKNVLVLENDPIWVKIADFGISKCALDGKTELRTRAGTVGYRAPEVECPDNTKEDSSYTSAVDMWSLGCLLYYTLTKQTPFSAYGPLENYYKGRTAFPDGPLRERGVSYSGRVFIRGLLNPFPEARPKASIELLTNWVISQTTNGSSELPDPNEGVQDTTAASGSIRNFAFNNPIRLSSREEPLPEFRERSIFGVRSNLDRDEMVYMK